MGKTREFKGIYSNSIEKLSYLYFMKEIMSVKDGLTETTGFLNLQIEAFFI